MVDALKEGIFVGSGLLIRCPRSRKSLDCPDQEIQGSSAAVFYFQKLQHEAYALKKRHIDVRQYETLENSQIKVESFRESLFQQ